MIWHKDTHTHKQQGRVPVEVKKFFWLLQPIQYWSHIGKLRNRLYSYSVSEAEPLPQLSRPLPSVAQPATGHGLAMWNKTWALIWETSRLTVPFLRFLYTINKHISWENGSWVHKNQKYEHSEYWPWHQDRPWQPLKWSHSIAWRYAP